MGHQEINVGEYLNHKRYKHLLPFTIIYIRIRSEMEKKQEPIKKSTTIRVILYYRLYMLFWCFMTQTVFEIKVLFCATAGCKEPKNGAASHFFMCYSLYYKPL